MSILLVEKKGIDDPMKWFADTMGFEGKCIREFREYFDDVESNVDVGILPEFGSWVDVASYVERM